MIALSDGFAKLAHSGKKGLRRNVSGRQYRDGAIVAGNDNALASFHSLHKPRELHFRFRDIENSVLHRA
jgi:hypothetical protein